MTARENPIGLDGFEFVEFTSPDPEAHGRTCSTKLGFTHLGNHRSKNVRHYAQGDINFILNMEPAGQAADFRDAHGPSANGMAFRVGDAKQAFAAGGRARRHARSRARAGRASSTSRRSRGSAAPISIWSTATAPSRSTTSDFEPVPGATRDDNAVGLHTLDHLTHNVNRGRMDHWAQFYERIFNFRQIRYFDIEGKQTALLSRAMTAPDDKIRIPLNESQDEHSQIEEFLQGI